MTSLSRTSHPRRCTTGWSVAELPRVLGSRRGQTHLAQANSSWRTSARSPQQIGCYVQHEHVSRPSRCRTSSGFKHELTQSTCHARAVRDGLGDNGKKRSRHGRTRRRQRESQSERALLAALTGHRGRKWHSGGRRSTLESEQNIIARAFELARSGECRSVGELQKQLKCEGHSAVEEHLRGPSFRGELRKIFTEVSERRKSGS